MSLDPDTLKLIEDQISRALAANTLVYQMRIDLALKEASQARGVAESANASIERSIEGLARELHNGLGRLDNENNNIREAVRKLSVIVATNESRIEGIQASVFGDERLGTPSIKRDIDGITNQLRAVKNNLDLIEEITDRLAGLEKGSETIYRDLKTLLLIQRLINFSGDKMLKPVWQLFDRYRWVKIAVGFGSPAIAILIEFLKAIGVL